MTVLPHPKAPGIAHVPPWIHGNNASRIRWPVTSGVVLVIFSAVGLGFLTGQWWAIVNSSTFPLNSIPMILSSNV